MKTKKFISLFKFPPKSKIKAGDGLDEGNFPFYTSSSILKKRIDKAQHFDEALIFGTGGSASIHFSKEPFATSTDCIVAISENKDLNTKYVYYYLFDKIHLLERGFKGAGLKHISKKHIENIDIPIIPIETQNKIVSVLDKANSLVLKREKTLELLKSLLKSKYSELIGKNFKNVLKFKPLEKYTIKITDGTHQSPKFTDNGIPFLFVSNIIDNEINSSTKKFISQEEHKILNKRTPIEIGDILITSVGSYGNAALVKTITKFAFQRHIAYIKPNKELINNIFLFETLKSSYTQFQIEKAVRGAAQKTLNLRELKKIEIPVVSRSRQNQFAVIAENIYSKKTQLQTNLSELKKLSKSLTQKVFNGQLNFNVDFELDALIKEIDLQKEENDLSKIAGDIAYLQRLIDKLNDQEFTEKELYDKGRHGVFQLMSIKEKDRKIIQKYYESSKSLKLALK